MPRVRWPKRGSLSYSPRKRAKTIKGRIDYWPEVSGPPQLLGFIGYKVGMTHVFVINDRERSPDFGKEVMYAASVIDAPPLIIGGIRAYEDGEDGLKAFTEVWAEKIPENIKKRIESSALKSKSKKTGDLVAFKDRIKELRAIAITQPNLSGLPKKKPEIVEIKIGGGAIEDQINYSNSLLGKQIKASDVFKPGEPIDIVGVTKGKGFQGPVKRWGVRILQNKARKTKRGVATTGPWHPARVMPGVPRAGQMGFHSRTEFNKRILFIGEDGSKVTPPEGFQNYGLVKGDYLIIKGSVMGPAKRILRFRKTVRRSRYPEAPPKITFTYSEYLKSPGRS
ncbi:50S ribosomal protein L3 [Candidatus Bathyarchaeota archaeon]|nr:50S ribosomal protein L3 [Candidatus Bathyarchaeota archaeon]MBS7630745.1 50S ribosomal protein L3 [Candidatus Bathyarchaeota archaeon]